MDIEDAISKGWLDVSMVLDKLEEKKRLEWVDELKEKFGENVSGRKKCMDLRTMLFSYLISLSNDNFIGHLSEIEKGTYQKELIFDDEKEVAKSLKELCDQKVLLQREIQSLEVTGNAVISGLFDVYIHLLFHEDKGFRKRGKSLISKTVFLTVLHEHLDLPESAEYYENFDVNSFSVAERLRLIRDFVAGMTDKFALNHYRKLSGQQIS